MHICMVSWQSRSLFCLVLVIFSNGQSVAAFAQDPCGSAANIELCHYEQAKSLLAQLSPSQDASPPRDALVEVAQEVRSVVNPATQEIISGPATIAGSTGSADFSVEHNKNGSSSTHEATVVEPYVDPAKDDRSSSESDALQLKNMVLKQALDVLEGEAPASPSLENVTMHLEEALEDIEPGALDTFRSQHLAAAINAERPPPPATHLRAAVAARVLSMADWGNGGQVAADIAKLELVGLHGRTDIDPDTYLCSKKSCGMFGCGTGADPSNSECDQASARKCADGHGKCSRSRGQVLDGLFTIEIMGEPGNFLYMPPWDDSQVSAVSKVKHKAGKPGPDGQWHVVLNSDNTIMLYTKEWGPDYFLSVEEDKGELVLAYRGFTSPVAVAFTVHTNKGEDQIYLRDVPFKSYITNGGDGEFKPDVVLDKKAANLKFHPPLPEKVEMIADSAHCMSVIPLIAVCALFNF